MRTTRSARGLCYGAAGRLQLLNYKSSRSPCIMHLRLRLALIKQIGSARCGRFLCSSTGVLHARSAPLCPLNCHNKLTRHDVSGGTSVRARVFTQLREVQYLRQHLHAPLRCNAMQRDDSSKPQKNRRRKHETKC